MGTHDTRTTGIDPGKSFTSNPSRNGTVGVRGAQSLEVDVAVVNSYDKSEGVSHVISFTPANSNDSYSAQVNSPGAALRTRHVLPPKWTGGEYCIRLTTPNGFDLRAPRQFMNFTKGVTKTVTLARGASQPVLFIITRKQSVLFDLPMTFTVEWNAPADWGKPMYESAQESKVKLYSGTIESEASRQDVDSNLVKAIMYMETTHGWYDAPLAAVDRNKSLLPMNVRADYWADLGFSRDDLKDPTQNIAAGVLLIKRIWDRVPNRTIDKVATLYQDLGATKVTDYGARVEKIYNDRAWQ